MLTLRLCGGTRDTSLPSSRIAPSVGRLEPGDHPQRRRLAAARRAEHREELARRDGEVGFVDRHVVVEALGDIVDLDDRAALGAGGPVLSRRFVYGGGVCAGQGEILLIDSPRSCG